MQIIPRNQLNAEQRSAADRMRRPTVAEVDAERDAHDARELAAAEKHDAIGAGVWLWPVVWPIAAVAATGLVCWLAKN